MKNILRIFLTTCIVLSASILKAQSGSTLVAVYQYYKSSTQRHFYTTDLNELGVNGGNGWVNNGPKFYIYPSPNATSSNNIYRFNNPGGGSHYYTKNKNVYPLHFVYEGIFGSQGYPPLFLGSAVYEYTKNGDDYYYTKDQSSAPVGYTLNGVAFNASTYASGDY